MAASLMAFSGVTRVRFTAAPTTTSIVHDEFHSNETNTQPLSLNQTLAVVDKRIKLYENKFYDTSMIIKTLHFKQIEEVMD